MDGGGMETEAAMRTIADENEKKRKPRRVVVIVAAFLLLLVLCAGAFIAWTMFIKGDAPSASTTDSDSEWFDRSIPQPNVPFVYDDGNGTWVNITLNDKVIYYSEVATPGLTCHVEWNRNGTVDTDRSFIQFVDDGSVSIEVGSVLLAAKSMFDTIAELDQDCTLVPAVVITGIEREDNASTTTLSFRLGMYKCGIRIHILL